MDDLTPEQLLADMDAYLAQQKAYLAQQDAYLAGITETMRRQHAEIAELWQRLEATNREVQAISAEASRLNAETSRSHEAWMRRHEAWMRRLEGRPNAQHNLFGERLEQQGGLFEESRDVEDDG